jgi:hypothetical protein
MAPGYPSQPPTLAWIYEQRQFAAQGRHPGTTAGDCSGFPEPPMASRNMRVQGKTLALSRARSPY